MNLTNELQNIIINTLIKEKPDATIKDYLNEINQVFEPQKEQIYLTDIKPFKKERKQQTPFIRAKAEFSNKQYA